MLESIDNQYRQIGYIARSHGVQGEVLVIPDLYAPSLFDSLELVRIKTARGDFVPARIESVRVQKKNNRLSFFIKFEHVTDRTQAEQLKQRTVFADREQIDHLWEDEEPATDFISYEIWSGDQQIGTVESVLDNPAHPILQITTQDQRQLLVPFTDEYVVAVHSEDQRIQCHNLEQLKGL